MIRIEDLEYTYESGTQALEHVSVEFPRGTTSAVMGESGSGKTTLLMCLGRFLQPTGGAITLDGDNIFEIPEQTYRKQVGIVFQRLYLFPHMTVRENMTLAPRRVLDVPARQARTEAMDVLDRLGIADLAENYPSQISGGQAQRAAIARGLVLRPEYMLLDEPTSALDANTTDEFAAWLREIHEETNFIIVTHDLPFARKVASQGVYLSDGRVQDTGEVETIIGHVRSGQLVTEETE
ncbi:MAG: amino acid ABC transporter ATP-binding protein [Planctomycetota bacterium]